MRKFHLIYFIVLFACWIFQLSSAIRNRRKNEANQQTFVVRYKNGDQTIPVTVVLDDKKQTEYVINMSPRTTDKSVTLYDFRQRTIAYKDLTNRECFLGRLTDETLKHEKDALSEVQNPIDARPKVLSLDSQRSALTPTEIRNIAGQKTAVFCRKMNTWLIKSQDNHDIRKREVEDIEEKTYSHRGFHTMQFPHQGHETRRRYQKITPTHLMHQNKHLRKEENENYESLVDSKNNKNDSLEQPSHFTGHVGNDHAQSSPFHISSLLPEKQFIHEHFPNNGDKKFHSQIANYHSLENYPHSLSNVEPVREGNTEQIETNSLNLNQGQTKDANLREDHLFQSIVLQKENRVTDDRIYAIPSQNRNTEIESESFDNFHDASSRKKVPVLHTVDDYTENPDVSINIHEIPKISAKFENIDRFQSPPRPLIHSGEDVHTIFEGFHNLQKNAPSSAVEYSNKFDNQLPNLVNNSSDVKTISPIISPLQENFAYEDIYQDHLTSLLTDLPTTTSEYFTTNSPWDIKNRHANKRNEMGSSLNEIDDSLSTSKSFYLPIIENQQNESQSLYNDSFSFISLYNNLNKTNINNIKNSSRGKYIVGFNNSINSHPITSSVQEEIPPRHLRFQNILRLYKPDEIVIDIGKIPTEKPQHSTSDFRDGSYSRNSIPSENRFANNFFRPNNSVRSETSNILPTNNLYHHRPNSRRKLFSGQRHIQSNHHPFFGRNSHHLNNFHKHFPTSSIHLPFKPALQQNLPTYNNYPPRLDALPPGVSLHPRHPQAPYADMVHTNILHTLPQTNNHKSFKPHRQRHHKRKDRGCCRHNERSCCQGRTMRPNTSCCSQSRTSASVKLPRLEPPRRLRPQPSSRDKDLKIHSPPNDSPPPQKSNDDNTDRCQKEKMCRTLYESTKQVIVCRNADIEGC